MLPQVQLLDEMDESTWQLLQRNLGGLSEEEADWRSHPEAMNFGEAKNLSFSRVVNNAGGEVLLDHRVRRGGRLGSCPRDSAPEPRPPPLAPGRAAGRW